MGVGEWSRANGVDGRSLVAWQTNLAHRAAATHVSKPALIELVPATSPRPEGRYVVRVGEVAIEVADDFHDDTLARLVRVLRSC